MKTKVTPRYVLLNERAAKAAARRAMSLKRRVDRGETITDIAAELGVTRQRVSMLVNKARRILKEKA